MGRSADGLTFNSLRVEIEPIADRFGVGRPRPTCYRRAVELDGRAVAALRAHRSYQAEERLSFGPAYRDQSLVFCRPDGTPYDPNAGRSHLRVCNASGRRNADPPARLLAAPVRARSLRWVKVVQDGLGASSSACAAAVI